LTAKKINVDSNLNELIQDEQDILVEFYSPTCGPCKMLNFVLDDVAKELDDGYTIAQVNFDEAADMVEEYEVKGYPTVFIYKNGEQAKRFSGVTNKETIMKHIKGA